MAQALKSISVALFALLILAVSSGFYVNKHYCAGELQHVAINQEAPSCHEQGHKEGQTPACHQPQEKSCHNDPVDGCCESENQTIQTDQYTFQNQQVTFDVQVFAMVVPVIDLIFEDNLSNKNIPTNLAESPPPQISDKQVLFQSFLL